MSISDNSIDTLLGEAGLNQSERQAYIAGLAGSSTSAELLHQTGMPRPTLMAALQSLRQYGLCDTRQRDGRSLMYTMLPVTNLKAHLGQKMRSLDSLMDRLDNVDDTNSVGISVQDVTGQAAVQDLLEAALRCKSRQWNIIAPKDNALSYLPVEYLSYFKRVRRERQIQSQTLWESSRSDEQISLYDVLMRKPRYVPSGLQADIPSLMLAYDDSLLILDGTTHPTGVVISAPTVVATFGLLFEMAWRYAKAD